MNQFDKVANIYDDNLKELLNNKNTEQFAEYKIQLVKLLAPKITNKLMDFGCGTGRSFPFLKKYFPNGALYGCDVSNESIKFAERYISPNCLFLNNSIESLSCKGKMDIVIACCVFHHIAPEERKNWINGIINILEENGRFFIFEHNIKNPMTKKIILDPKNLVDNINVMLPYENLISTIKSIQNTKIVWKGYTLFSPWRSSFITGFERLLKWLPFGAQYCVVIEKN